MKIKALIEKHKKLIYVMSILALIPVGIGGYYIYEYDWCNVTTEWGAVATWYAGLLSICLLYMTLQQQHKDNQNVAEQQALQHLRENTKFLSEVLVRKIELLSGKIVDCKSLKYQSYKAQDCKSWLEKAPEEIENLYKLLCRNTPLTDFETAKQEYENAKTNERSKIACLFEACIHAKIAQEYSIYSDWWQSKKRTEQEVKATVKELFIKKHPEFRAVIDILTFALVNINKVRQSYNNNQEANDYKTLAYTLFAYVKPLYMDFFCTYIKYDRGLMHLIENLDVASELHINNNM